MSNKNKKYELRNDPKTAVCKKQSSGVFRNLSVLDKIEDKQNETYMIR